MGGVAILNQAVMVAGRKTTRVGGTGATAVLSQKGQVSCRGRVAAAGSRV